VLAGYPARVARRRAAGSPRLLLASGHGAVLAAESGVRSHEFAVALDVSAGRKGEGSEALVRIASGVERDWLQPTAAIVEHWIDQATGSVRAAAKNYYEAFVLSERPQTPDPAEAARLVADAYLARGLTDADEQLLRRVRFAGADADAPATVRRAAEGARTLGDVDLASGIDASVRRQLDRHAPEWLEVPSGRRVRLEYDADGSVRASVKLQELFGLADTPRVGRRGEPVLLALLAPSGRPVQLTRDLRSFWDRTYPDVRKELRGRYPRHPWPEDPWSAPPTAKPARRGSK
jgi:ATP-dependent helicase HrpB